MTRAQLDPSAQAPWASTTLTSFIAILLFLSDLAHTAGEEVANDRCDLRAATLQRKMAGIEQGRRA
jgi:hypothetical protein